MQYLPSFRLRAMRHGRQSTMRLAAFSIAAMIAASALPAHANAAASAASYLDRLPEDEVIYFVLPDRFENGDPSNDLGGLPDDRLKSGFDPTHKGFFHGGDLRGLTRRLDYIKGLGASAIWLGPIYKNKPVQGRPGEESAGYHGYWITDFTDVDPHFGTKEDLKEFVAGAHARGMKVYLDIITNHSADVIAFKECHDPAAETANAGAGPCLYRSKADYPYGTRGGPAGPRINAGFMGDGKPHQTASNFEALKDPTFAYAPFVPDAEKTIKVPAWMNDPIFYHNRGNTTFEGESSTYGDFVGLDDFMTEDPRVVDGFIDIYKKWVSDYKIDGFRIDTAKHVNVEFWTKFLPALKEHAAKEGMPNFVMFGEAVYWDVASLAGFMKEADFHAALDFPMMAALRALLIEGGSGHDYASVLKADLAYEEAQATARRLPVFIGNHDMGRYGGELRKKRGDLSDAELLKNARLAHAFLFFSRGAPVIYYGDEQGFTGDGGDQDARETMFPSRVDVYNDNELIGSTATTGESNFNPKHPLYRSIAEMARARRAHPALRRGDLAIRHSEKEGGGVIALSRFDPTTGEEFLFVANTGPKPRELFVEVDPGSAKWRSVIGKCSGRAAAPSSYRVSVAGFDYVLCRSPRVRG
jgi:glycosidase